MKQIIMLNIINLILIALAGVCIFTLPVGISIVIGVAVLIFALYSNYVLLVRNQDDDYLLKNADKRGIFKKQVRGFISQRESLKQRRDTIDDDEKLLEVYELVCRQVDNNVDSAIKFMEMYDYVQRPDTRYLDDLFVENQQLIVNLNEVVEQFIKIENSAHDVDTTYIDDLLVSLKEMH